MQGARTRRVRPDDEASKNLEFILDFLSEEERKDLRSKS